MAPKTIEEAEKSLAKAIAYTKAAQSQIQPHRNYVIPEHTSSRIAPRARQVSQGLRQETETLQYKASYASLASSTSSVKSIDYLRAQQQLLRSQSQEWKNVDEGLVEAFTALSSITKEQYQEEQLIIQKRRFELVSKEIIIARNMGKFQSELKNHEEPDWPSVIMDLISKTFLRDRQNKVDPEDRRSKTVHGEWKDLIRSYYNAYDPKDSTRIWCPITQRYHDGRARMKTAHIVPHGFGYKNISHAFGDPGKGMELMWSSGNGIPMLGCLEAVFDEGRWTMIGHPQEGSPVEYTLVVIDDSILNLEIRSGKKFKEYNNKRLVFKNDNRPNAKFVYWHYATSLLRHYKQQTPGIEKKIRELVDGRAWGNTGPWYDSSTLKFMAEYWGDVATRVFKGTEIHKDEMAGMGGMSLKDDVEEEDSRLAAGAVFKELISDDFPEVVEDEYVEEGSEL